MKKIWPWLLALLLLIIFCVWTKKDSIHVSSDNSKNVVQQPVVSSPKHYINYEIMQQGDTYTLNGNFTNIEQQNKLNDTCIAASSSLKQGNTSTNETLLGKDAITLTNKILPHFIQHYKNGKIVYSNRTLRIYGDVDSYEAQHKMQQLLNSSTLSSQDNSTVTVQKPVHFLITKKGNDIAVEGQFNDDAQSAPIRSQLPSTANIHLSSGKNLVDNGAIAVTQNILPLFIEKYTEGSIAYNNEKLTVTGMVATESDLNKVHTLLSDTGMPIIDLTTVDTEALAKAKAEEEAIRKAAQAQLLAQAEAKRVRDAEAKRMALEIEARRLAQEEATKRAQEEEAKRMAQKIESRRLAQEEANKKVKVLHNTQNIQQTEAAAAKRNIISLLKIQNIEFEVAKGSLTPRGKGTVDKLANILKQYPHIKIEIAGHTDSDGSATFNQNLSQSRVNTVQKRLITKGISANRLTAKGYGETQPLVPNTSDENKQRNRRVEINIQGE